MSKAPSPENECACSCNSGLPCRFRTAPVQLMAADDTAPDAPDRLKVQNDNGARQRLRRTQP